MLSATPVRRRTSASQSRPPPSVRSRATPRSTARITEAPEDTEEPEVPEYQAPEAPLSLDAHRDLHKLLEKKYLETLLKHIHNAGANITHSAGEVSDRLRDAQTRYMKAKEKRRSDEDGQDRNAEGDDEEYQRLAEQERKVNAIMGRLEEKMRGVVDGETKCIELKEALGKLHREEAQVQHVLVGDRQLRGQRRTTRRMGDEDGENEEDEEDAERESTPVRELRERNAENPPSKRLKTWLAESQRKWEELSLTQRYALLIPWTMLMISLTSSNDPDTPRITLILGSTASCTTPSTPTTKLHPCRTPLHGSPTWKKTLVQALQVELHQTADATSASHHLQIRTTSPSSASASRWIAPSLWSASRTRLPAPSAHIASSTMLSWI